MYEKGVNITSSNSWLDCSGTTLIKQLLPILDPRYGVNNLRIYLEPEILKEKIFDNSDIGGPKLASGDGKVGVA